MSKLKIAAVPLTLAAVLIPAAAAAASPFPYPATVQALTKITDRPDGGNGTPDPYWADDSMSRVITITRTGGTPGAWTFTATLADTRGTFTTIKGAQAPNQGAPYTGQVIKAQVTGTFTGYADYSFTASQLPRWDVYNAGLPAAENNHGLVPSDSTSTWYEKAFPAGTVFSGTGITDWSWTYQVRVPQARYPFLVTQKWVDSSSNGYGDLAGDGEITG